MSQRNARQKNKRLMSQPPLLTFEGNQPLSPTNDDPNTSPLASTLPQSSQNSDSERTVSASPNNAPSPPTSPRNRPTIHPIGNKSFEPCLANREVRKQLAKGSITMTEHRRRLKEKLGEEPSHAALFQATHKSKKTDSFVCKKAQQVMQTQPELGDSNVWYEAAGGLKKGGYVFGFGSDTPHYFPEVDQVAWLVAEVAALRGSNQQRSQSTDRADSHESSGVGLDDLGLNDDTQSPTQAQ
nr:putative transposase En/Spm [Ipomoea batatas]